MTTAWIRSTCLAWLCLIPFLGNAVTPMIVAGKASATALKSDGTVLTWGYDDFGVLGIGRSLLQKTFAQIPGLNVGTGITQGMVAANGHTLIVDSTGNVWAWGNNDSGQLGDGTNRSRTTPARIAGLTGVRAAFAGNQGSFFLKTDGTVWETDFSGHLWQVRGLSSAIQVEQNIALTSDGTVWTWGQNTWGDLGNGTASGLAGNPPPPHTAGQVPGLSGVIAVSGTNGKFAVKSDGTVWAWGFNGRGGLGDGTTTDRWSPVPLNIPGRVAAKAGFVVLMADGTLSNLINQQLTPLMTGVRSFSAGSVTLAERSDGTVWGQGRNANGELGNGTTAPTPGNAPEQIPVQSIAAFAAGQEGFTVLVKTDGTVWMAGSNALGNLGIGTNLFQPTPAVVPGLSSVTALAMANSFIDCVLAIASDQTVWGWGNARCLKFSNVTSDLSSPAPLSGLTGVVAAAVNATNIYVLKSDGSVWAWGERTGGGVGDGIVSASSISTGPPSTPVAGITNAAAIAAGGGHVLVLKADGTVWAWGGNAVGEIGDGSAGGGSVTSNPRSRPFQVPGLSGVTAIAAGLLSSAALKSDGTVWAWGMATGTSVVSPTQVAGLSNIARISVGTSHLLALDGSGKVWSVGAGGSGQLGTGSGLGAAPMQVAALTGIVDIAAGAASSYALAADGTAYAWGDNSHGQIGDGTFALQRTPVLVVNPTFNGPLDLRPEVPNQIPASLIPSLLLSTNRSSDLNNLSLSADIRGLTSSGSFASATDFGKFAAGYNVYVAAFVPAIAASPYFQLNSNGSWSALSWPMSAFLSGAALDSQTSLVRAQILQNADLSSSALEGTSIIVGYGTDPDEMLRAARFRTIFTVPTQ